MGGLGSKSLFDLISQRNGHNNGPVAIKRSTKKPIAGDFMSSNDLPGLLGNMMAMHDTTGVAKAPGGPMGLMGYANGLLGKQIRPASGTIPLPPNVDDLLFGVNGPMTGMRISADKVGDSADTSSASSTGAPGGPGTGSPGTGPSTGGPTRPGTSAAATEAEIVEISTSGKDYTKPTPPLLVTEISDGLDEYKKTFDDLSVILRELKSKHRNYIIIDEFMKTLLRIAEARDPQIENKNHEHREIIGISVIKLTALGNEVLFVLRDIVRTKIMTNTSTDDELLEKYKDYLEKINNKIIILRNELNSNVLGIEDIDRKEQAMKDVKVKEFLEREKLQLQIQNV